MSSTLLCFVYCKQARKLQDAQAVKLTSLKVDKLKSQPADKIAIIRISGRTRDATLRGVNSQLDIGERDAKDVEDKYPNTVLNFNGDLKYSKWGPQTFKMGTSNIHNGDIKLSKWGPNAVGNSKHGYQTF